MRDPRVIRAESSMRAQGGGPRSDRFTSPLTNPSAVNHHLRQEQALLDLKRWRVNDMLPFFSMAVTSCALVFVASLPRV